MQVKRLFRMFRQRHSQTRVNVLFNLEAVVVCLCVQHRDLTICAARAEIIWTMTKLCHNLYEIMKVRLRKHII